MSTFLSKLADRLSGRSRKVERSFADLVTAIADDRPPAPEQAEAVLADSGRTVADLAAAVERLKARRRARADLDAARLVPAQRDKAAATIAAANTAFEAAVEAARRKFWEVVNPLEARIRELDAAEERGRQAEALLREAEPDEGTAAELTALRERLAVARKARDDARHKAARLGREAGEAGLVHQQAGDGGWNNPALSQNKAAFGRHSAELAAESDRLEREAQPHAEECRRLEAEIAAMEDAALLVP
jgi:hypothetical protein